MDKADIARAFQGKLITPVYDKKHHFKLEDICFTKSPKDHFEVRDAQGLTNRVNYV